MTFLNVLYRNGIWISIPLFLAAAAALTASIAGLAGLGAKDLLFFAPLKDQQQVRFSEAGPVVLSVEGPRATDRFANLAYELVAGNDAVVKGRTTWLHTRRSGMSSVQMEMERFEIPLPGRYILRIKGLGRGQSEDPAHRIVFTRPNRVQTIGYILGIILSAGLLIGSAVFFVLRLIKGRGGV
jgi:hypothetical protein